MRKKRNRFPEVQDLARRARLMQELLLEEREGERERKRERERESLVEQLLVPLKRLKREGRQQLQQLQQQQLLEGLQQLPFEEHLVALKRQSLSTL